MGADSPSSSGSSESDEKCDSVSFKVNKHYNSSKSNKSHDFNNSVDS